MKFNVYDFCKDCAAEIACEEFAFEEFPADRISPDSRCIGCGKWFRQRGISHAGIHLFRTTTERASLTEEQIFSLLNYCRRKAEERRGNFILEMYSPDASGGERDSS